MKSRLPQISFISATLLLAVISQAIPVNSQEEEVVEVFGTLNIIWPHPDPGKEPDPGAAPGYMLVDDAGEIFMLDLDLQLVRDQGGPLHFNRKDVRITGILDEERNMIIVRTIQLEEEVHPIFSHLGISHRSGSQKWATILCRFGDATDVTPASITYFEDLMEFMDDYWRELSYDNINLEGTVVAGWFDMPQDRAEYLDDPTTHFVGHTLNWPEAAEDCATAADAEVNFPDFDGVNFIFNQVLDGYSWGGSTELSLDGEVKDYSATWMSPGGWGNQDVLGQEMGHGFGLPHSSGPYTATYDSNWDVMSGGGVCSPADPDFGCIGPHTIGYHKDALGWILDARRYVATTDPDQLIFIERIAQPGAEGYLVAQIPIGGSDTNFYTVESRKFVGFDEEVPAEAVVIHKVDTTLDDRNAQLVDVDAIPNTNPNDAGARWLPGELFEDVVNGISVGIVEMTDSGFWVIINPTVADLSVEKTDLPDPVVAGEQISYTITIMNNGPDSAENVQVIDTLPAEVTHVSNTGGCVEGPTDTLTCDVGTLASSADTSFSVTVDVPADLAYNGVTLVYNTVEVSSDQFDTEISDNELTIGTQIIAEADVEITSFTASATPGELLIGDSMDVTLTKSIVNNGPSSPVDVDIDVTAVATAGIIVDPTAASQTFVELAIGETGEVVEVFTLMCTEPGLKQVTFTNTISPVEATDPDLSNNMAEAIIEVECVIPVKINIQPGGSPNSVNLKSKLGVIPVAILTTAEGEYGLPVAIDATMIDPLSVHFGPADLLFDTDPPGGATEIHNIGHIQDSFELDEITKDGDFDMLLHFSAPASGLDSTDTEACVKGEIEIGGMMYSFFGCDAIVPRP